MTTRGLRAMGVDPALLWLLAAPAWVVGRPSGSGEGHGVVGAAVADAAREVRQAARDAAHDLAGEARGAMESQPRRDEGPAPAPTSR